MKSDVFSWETVATFVVTDAEDAAYDVNVQVGKDDASWYIRTSDDSGGSDDCDDTQYAEKSEAVEAALNFAQESDEGCGLTAEDYRLKKLKDTAGDPCPGNWCVYWETSLEDSGPREWYETKESAEAAAELANRDLAACYPGGKLLCGFTVKHLTDLT